MTSSSIHDDGIWSCNGNKKVTGMLIGLDGHTRKEMVTKPIWDKHGRGGERPFS